jgi:hypothetical protein
VGDTDHLPKWIKAPPKKSPDGGTSSYDRCNGKPRLVPMTLRPGDTVILRPHKWQEGTGGATHVPLPSAAIEVSAPQSSDDAVKKVYLDNPT